MIINNSPRFTLLFTVVFILFSTGCGGGGSSEESSETVAQEYVDEVLSLMRQYAVTRYDVDWQVLEAEVQALATNAQSIQDTYPALYKALELLGTNHSFIITTSGESLYPSELDCEQQFSDKLFTRDDIGYLRVRGFTGSELQSREFANGLHAKLAEEDNENIRGWIVDLRDNTGGDMWPMIAGIGPLLGDGTYGHFIDPDNNISTWGYLSGASVFNDTNVVVVDSPYQLLNPPTRIAVLSSRRIASSGEATLISFKERDNVRVFGSNSCGLSTANSKFDLSDGSSLFLTVSTMADKNMLKYGGEVSVDIEVSQDEVVDVAVEWLIE